MGRPRPIPGDPALTGLWPRHHPTRPVTSLPQARPASRKSCIAPTLGFLNTNGGIVVGGSRHTLARLPLQLDFFVYSRDAADTADLRDDQELLEEHWSYMDRFAESMIARGPTLDTDRETATGSLHVLALPSVDAAREFVALEPNNRAGVYEEHLVWRFENLLGRSMWEFSGQPAEPRFLIIGRSHRGRPVSAETLPAELSSG